MKLFENINPGFYVFLALFAVITIVHLYFCFRMIPKWRKITKPFCMFFLGTAFLFLAPTQYLIWVSCYCSMIGDIFLIKNKKPFDFIVGAIVFASAHTMNAINQVMLLSYTIDYYVYIPVAVFILLIGVISFAKTKTGNKAIAAVGSSYACFHIMNIILAIILMIDGKTNYIIFVLIGYLIYVVSDFIVNYVTNTRDIKRRDFYIMITYLLGQLGIYFGIALTIH